MVVYLKKIQAAFFIWLFLAILIGCQTVQYYSQAIEGHQRILSNRKPIAEITADPQSPDFLRKKLAFILKVREFAENKLQLPAKDHYLTYVQLERQYVVWNVFAAPELSLEPKRWCYPVVGCAAYRGYFSEKDAVQYADSLKNQGYDVYVGGVTAYSTLGWFDDPVLSTFIHLSDSQLAALIFHELAHQVLYVKGDTTFNESFATFVEQEGLRRWQKFSGSTQFYSQYLDRYSRRHQFIQLILNYRQKLELLYQTDLPLPEKREKKASIFSELLDEFNHLKKDRINLAAYDGWMSRSLNNAKISSVVAYNDFVPAFGKLLAEKNGNLHQFYTACHELGKKDKEQRHRVLKELMEMDSQ
jgi:predicted aminopeptidase